MCRRRSCAGTCACGRDRSRRQAVARRAQRRERGPLVRASSMPRSRSAGAGSAGGHPFRSRLFARFFGADFRGVAAARRFVGADVLGRACSTMASSASTSEGSSASVQRDRARTNRTGRACGDALARDDRGDGRSGGAARAFGLGRHRPAPRSDGGAEARDRWRRRSRAPRSRRAWAAKSPPGRASGDQVGERGSAARRPAASSRRSAAWCLWGRGGESPASARRGSRGAALRSAA